MNYVLGVSFIALGFVAVVFGGRSFTAKRVPVLGTTKPTTKLNVFLFRWGGGLAAICIGLALLFGAL